MYGWDYLIILMNISAKLKRESSVTEVIRHQFHIENVTTKWHKKTFIMCKNNFAVSHFMKQT